jgi:hypothetical protein
MWRVEFHCHTITSKDSLSRPADLLRACQRKEIHRLVITDHNTTAGAVEAQRLDPERVILGEEIMTREGELLAAFVTEEIPPDLPALEAIQRLRQQGAFISVSHPFDYLRSGSWHLSDLEKIAPLVDAIETFNARCLRPAFNDLAQAFAHNHGLPGAAGSDAHTVFEVGRACVLLPPFTDAVSLRAALKQAKIVAALSSPWVRLASRYAVVFKAMKAFLKTP